MMFLGLKQVCIPCETPDPPGCPPQCVVYTQTEMIPSWLSRSHILSDKLWPRTTGLLLMLYGVE